MYLFGQCVKPLREGVDLGRQHGGDRLVDGSNLPMYINTEHGRTPEALVHRLH